MGWCRGADHKLNCPKLRSRTNDNLKTSTLSRSVNQGLRCTSDEAVALNFLARINLNHVALNCNAVASWKVNQFMFFEWHKSVSSEG